MPPTTLLLATLILPAGALQDPQRAAPIPVREGLTVVQAVSGDAYQGRDYEAVIAIGRVSAGNVTLESSALVKDRAGERRRLHVSRTVLADDLGSSRTLVLGFDTDDPERLPGTTAIGPSRLVLDELRRTGRAGVSVRRHASHPDAAGTLERVEGRVAFPLLVNGVRVNVPALHARGRLGVWPWEFWFLDHPVQPLTLKVVHGAEGGPDARRVVWSRQIVRIDAPVDVAALELDAPSDSGGTESADGDLDLGGGGGTLPPAGSDSAGAGGYPGGAGDGVGPREGGAQTGAGGSGRMAGGAGAGDNGGRGPPGDGAGGLGAGLGAGTAAAMETGLAGDCRVSVPGIYFEFDSDVLNPASAPWIRAVADLLRRHSDWTVTIEGHTDSIGGVRYNQDLSSRRAAALQRSLVTEHGIAEARLATRGFGSDRPLESNSTVEGRARNRRVELVRPCDAP